METGKSFQRKPNWLISKTLGARNTAQISHLMHKYKLNTVCESAKCPNRGECFEKGTAVFLILGNKCTRNCRFCAIENTKIPHLPDKDEPKRVAKMTKKLGLKHVIVTSVTRDDLVDGGASHFVETVYQIRKLLGREIIIELLTPDFMGKESSLDSIIKIKPTIFNHNLETVKRLYPFIRSKADYERSIAVLRYIKEKEPNIITKTGIMLGLGESKKEVIELFKDTRKNLVDFITLGQYLQATKYHIMVKEYIHPSIFKYYKEIAYKMGFLYVESSPLTRSSYYSGNINQILKSIYQRRKICK